MSKYILDTNVLLAADGRSAAALACVEAAKSRLNAIRQHGILVLDTEYLILKEYGNKLSPIGPNTPGNAFLKWVLQNRANPLFCEQETLLRNDDGSFAAFPTDPALAAFDPSDRKFVALALAHPDHPPIVNATDTDWHHDREALTRNGVRIEFICPAEMTRTRI